MHGLGEFACEKMKWIKYYVSVIMVSVSNSQMLIITEMTKRDVPGFAVGGLSGGEEKEHFWRMVKASTELLPREKPRYLMGVG